MKKALIVGINDYPDSSRLFGCENDAKAMANILEFNEDGSKNFDIQLETDIHTKGELNKKIRLLFTGEADVALFYFSGHGFCDEGGGIIVTPDYSECDMGVLMDQILCFANESKCKNKIIILDCCYSGNMGLSNNNGKHSIIGNGVTILTASSPQENAIEIGEHGVFTALLLSALKGEAANILGKITPGSVYSYVDQALGAWNQRPIFKTNITKFISIRDVEPRIKLSDLKQLENYFKSSSDEYNLDPSYEDTNCKTVEHIVKEPFAKAEHVNVFKNLQKLERIGLIEPVGAEYMYFAAMNSKSCKLTPLGQYYWKLICDKRL